MPALIVKEPLLLTGGQSSQRSQSSKGCQERSAHDVEFLCPRTVLLGAWFLEAKTIADRHPNLWPRHMMVAPQRMGIEPFRGEKPRPSGPSSWIRALGEVSSISIASLGTRGRFCSRVSISHGGRVLQRDRVDTELT